MLILAKITTTSAAGYAEYLEGKAQAPALGDYYVRGGERVEAPGRWAQGAAQFGLDPDQPVTGEQLHMLMDVRRPDTGGELRRAGGTGEAVAALDATFSAPKSVSAVWALAGPELRAEIERAHETAIDRALAYAIRQVPMLRRRVSQDTVVHEKAAGLVATSWRHTTARAVGQQVPDPQLHSHVLLHAAVRRDGRIVAIDSRSWLVHQREVGAAYRTELARELTELGFGVRRGTGRGGRYFELDAIPQPLLDRWSSRHHQVHAAIRQRLADQERELIAKIAGGGAEAAEAAIGLELLRQTGQLSPAEERMMGAVTRSQKALVTVGDLEAEWRRTALGLGVSGERIEVLRHQPLNDLRPATTREVLDGLTEFDATFPARDARAVALERSAGTPIQLALDQLRELRLSDEILVLADGAGTTRQHRGRERTVVAIAERLAACRLEPLPATVAAGEAERLDRELSRTGGRLSDEQRAAITLACDTRPLVIIEGQAGTGKSTTLTGIARAHQASGQHILITSTAALAAERLASELAEHGVQCQAYSTAGLHAAITHGRIAVDQRTTIIHDEAALASTTEQLGLLDAVETARARMIAVGDPKQNQPVGAGGLWENIEQTTRAAGAHVELTYNQRARDPADRRDQALFREGHAERAIRGYAARERIHLHDDPRRAEDQALDVAHADRAKGKSTAVIVQTSNDQLDALNARAQAIRYQAGELGEDSLPIPGRPYELRQGDHVHIRHTTQHPDCGPLRNGTPAEITAIDLQARTLALRLHDDTVLTLTEPQIADGDLRLAYVQHPFPAQGQTADTTHLIISGHASREGAYVGLTRARDRTDIYAAVPAERDSERDRLQDLAEHMKRTEPEMPSIRAPLAHENALTTTANIEGAHPSETCQLGREPQADPQPERTLDTDARPRWESSPTNRQNAGEATARSWPTAHDA
ncbi:MAG: relaxase domain-containing protein, partial [Solirubrobacterales bacterium]|nr:relaxase domain-containing protein [Solirubrobacterales bacterium]